MPPKKRAPLLPFFFVATALTKSRTRHCMPLGIPSAKPHYPCIELILSTLGALLRLFKADSVLRVSTSPGKYGRCPLLKTPRGLINEGPMLLLSRQQEPECCLCLLCLVCIACLVCLVCLVCMVCMAGQFGNALIAVRLPFGQQHIWELTLK